MHALRSACKIVMVYVFLQKKSIFMYVHHVLYVLMIMVECVGNLFVVYVQLSKMCVYH